VQWHLSVAGRTWQPLQSDLAVAQWHLSVAGRTWLALQSDLAVAQRPLPVAERDLASVTRRSHGQAMTCS
jgi:hypothetical protein